MERLPLGTQTLYAELMELLIASGTHRSIGHLPGCFTTKSIKGEVYYYYQYTAPGGDIKQVYIGKKSSVLDKFVKGFLKEREGLKSDIEHVQRLCAQLRIGGAIVTDAVSSRVLKALEESGIFHLGGVLVGTHAFTVIGNLLGFRWHGAAIKTQDIDIARERGLSVAIPLIHAGIPAVLERLKMGFLPVPPLNPKNPSTSFKVRGKALRVDILTPQRKEESGPVSIPVLNTAAQPMRFLDYLIENPEWGAVVDGGGVLVKVPNPARFAFHKLIISRLREVTSQDKAQKDVMQASQVLSVLADDRPGDLLLAWDEIKRRGRGWVKRTSDGLNLLRKINAEEYEKVARVINVDK